MPALADVVALLQRRADPALAEDWDRVGLVSGDPARETSRVLFAVKEAVYKAVHPLDGIFLDFPDVEVDLAAGIARTSYGRTVPVRVATGPHIVALAYLAG